MNIKTLQHIGFALSTGTLLAVAMNLEPAKANLANQHQNFATCNVQNAQYVDLTDTQYQYGPHRYQSKHAAFYCVINGVVYNDSGYKIAKLNEVLGVGEGRGRRQYSITEGLLSLYTCRAEDYWSTDCTSRPLKKTFKHARMGYEAKTLQAVYRACNNKISVPNGKGYTGSWNDIGHKMDNCLLANGVYLHVQSEQKGESTTYITYRLSFYKS